MVMRRREVLLVAGLRMRLGVGSPDRLQAAVEEVRHSRVVLVRRVADRMEVVATGRGTLLEAAGRVHGIRLVAEEGERRSSRPAAAGEADRNGLVVEDLEARCMVVVGKEAVDNLAEDPGEGARVRHWAGLMTRISLTVFGIEGTVTYGLGDVDMTLQE